MAQTWTYTTTYAGTGSNTGWFQTEDTSITISATGSTFRPKTPRLKVAASASRNDWTWGSTRKVRASVHPSWRTAGLWITSGYNGSIASGAYSDWQTISDSQTYSTANYFNSSNPTVRTVSFGAWKGGYVDCVYDGSGTNSALYVPCFNNNSDANAFTIANVYIQLDVPPTATVSSLSYTMGGSPTNDIYANLTTASVTVSDSAAYYGGSISSIALTIGNQTVTSSSDGTFSILLDTGGVFTPTVTITDSRGQTYVETFSPITVNVYTAPSVSFDVARTTSAGVPDDEGTYGLIEAELTFTDVIATAQAPSVTITDEGGTSSTPTVTWYTSSALSTQVTWANVSSGDTVYGIFSGLNTNYSYQVSVRPRDSQGTGTAIVQTISSAFYTVDFLAGGHGIAFGQPASQTGFYCNMDAHFEADCIAQDMSPQDVSDFVDGLNVTGINVTDYVVEQGTSGIWTYRKWNSGKAECWGVNTRNTSLASNSHAAIGTSLPTFFVNEVPIAIANGGGTGQPNSFIAYTNTGGSSGAYYIDCYIRNNSGGACASQWAFFYAIGKWK